MTKDLIEQTKLTPIELALQVDEEGRTTAKKVYAFLELNPAHYARWSNSNIVENGFAEENVDFMPFTINGECGGQATSDFKLSASFAKKLCMKAGGKRGEKARDYFIKVEDKLKEIALRPKTQAELSLAFAQQLVNQEKQLNQLVEKVNATDNKLESIKEVVALNHIDWRKNSTRIINKIAEKLGDTGHIHSLRSESYKLLNESINVNLKQRLTNKRRKMAENGASETKRKNTNYLDVIEEDKKLITAYISIIKDMAIKHGIDLPKIDEV